MEAFARLVKPKPGQKRKILADVLKLAFLSAEYEEMKKVRAFIVVPHMDATAWMTGKSGSAALQTSWAQKAAKRFNISIKVLSLGEENEKLLRVATAKASKDATPRKHTR